MKKTLLIMVMALAVLLTQCRKPEVKFPSPVAPEGTTVSMTVTAGPGSKTDITTAGGITWSTGDKLYVGDGTKYVGYLTIVSGQNTPTGTFSGDVTLTGISEGIPQTFHFFYLGSNPPAVTSGASSVEVSFAEQTGLRENLGSCHVGYGSANGTVTNGVVTGINVTLVSKVALARFSFKKNSTDYTGALTLSGTNIYNKMTVNFNANGFDFTPVKDSNISLTDETSSEKYVMLVPVGTDSETLSFGGSASGTTTLENGIESNKFYGKSDAIAVSLHETVNMGLPEPYDKLEWATCNLGAEHPYDYGDYYAWGATETWYSAGGQSESPTWKDGYSDGYTWAHCPHTSGEYSSSNKAVFTKYVPKEMSATYGYGGYGDDETVLDAGDDAATVAWGSGWRMPTTEEWNALHDYTTNEWTDDYNGTGVAGQVLTSIDGKGTTLFLPAAGYRSGTELTQAGVLCDYWSVSLNVAYPYCAFDVRLNKVMFRVDLYKGRYAGHPLRPVR